MVFLYPHGTGSLSEDLELSISISLLKKYCKEDFTVFVVGSMPKIKADFEFVENSPTGSRYQKSIANQLLGAQIIGAPFILMNDDFFCYSDFNSVNLVYDMTITERIKYSKSPFYTEILTNSIKKETDLNFAVHHPMPVNNVQLFIECCKYCINNKASVRNIYGNYVNENIVKIKDVKLKSVSQITTNTLNSGWFSIGDEFLDKKGKQWLTDFVTKGFSSVSL